MFKRGSKDKEGFLIWIEKLNLCIQTGKHLVNDLHDLNEKKENPDLLKDYHDLKDKFTKLETKNLIKEIFSLKGKDLESEKNFRLELTVFMEDETFFLSEINKKIIYLSKLKKAIDLIEDIALIITENESKQQKLAKSIPKLRNTREIDIAVRNLNELYSLAPKEVQIDETFSEELIIRIKRTNVNIQDWTRKLDFIESSIKKYQSKIQNTKDEIEHKIILNNLHSWLDSSEVKIKKIKETIKSYYELINDENTPSKDLANFEKKLEQLKENLSSIKIPQTQIDGEEQTLIGMNSRISEISKLEQEISNHQEIVYTKLNYRLAYVRTIILEKMFLKSHQLSFTKVNYSLGLKNDLLLKGWLQEEKENEFLKNYLNKYLMLTNISKKNFKEKSEALFKSLQEFTNFERLNNEISYKASLKWLSQNDKKWL